MTLIEIDGKPIEVPDDLSDAELEQIANEIAGATARPNVGLVPSVKEAVLGGPANLLPGVVPLTSRVMQGGAEAAKDPEALAAGIKVGRPVAAGLASGGLGVAPAIWRVGLVGGGVDACRYAPEDGVEGGRGC